MDARDEDTQKADIVLAIQANHTLRWTDGIAFCQHLLLIHPGFRQYFAFIHRARIALQIYIREAFPIELKIHREIELALWNQRHRRFRFSDETGDEGGCNRAGAACQCFVFDAALIRANSNMMWIKDGNKVDIGTGRLKEGMMPRRPSNSNDIDLIRVVDQIDAMWNARIEKMRLALRSVESHAKIEPQSLGVWKANFYLIENGLGAAFLSIWHHLGFYDSR